jgi:EAL and modified HD-GYP domain-containing signal transduction protein
MDRAGDGTAGRVRACPVWEAALAADEGVMSDAAIDRAEVFVGRQPIFDCGLQVSGYELLFRSGSEPRAGVLDHEHATASVLSNALTEIGLQRLVGDRQAWINVSREFVLSGLVEIMPAAHTVLEILEDQEIDSTLIDAIRQLKRHGYRIALDDFISTPEADALLPLADIVKLDVRLLGREGVQRHVRALAPFNVTLLAEKVETHEEYEWCREAGCELFQGYFFCKPEIVRDRKVHAGRQTLLQFISILQDPAVQFNELETHITRDLALSYRLLCYINSAFFGLRQHVSSITQALVLLGVENLRRWATLSLFASVDRKPQELTRTALMRGQFCELAGASLPGVSPGELFTLGLFSVIDALVDAPIEQVVKTTPFPPAMRDALVSGTGPMGGLLQAVRHLEAGEPQQADALLPGASRLYLNAILWADDAVRALFDEPAQASAA